MVKANYEPEITYNFIPRGQSYVTSENTNEIVLDVGGLNENLVFDHHFPGGPTDCASMLVLNGSSRLDVLKEKNVQNVTIVVHKEPDFDCLCAAWLVTRYLKKRKFPKGSEWVAKYAALVDSGTLRIEDSYFVPATVIYAFYETVKKQTDRKTADEKDRWILDNAFKLMDWCATNLANITIDQTAQEPANKKMSYKMESAKIFTSEYDVLKTDREKYVTELADYNTCKKIDHFSVFNKKTNTPETVPALIYTKPSKSTLVKYWARADGYILALIPQSCDGVWNDAEWKPIGFSKRPNRVIISVPPEKGLYNLKPLAEELERAECELERKLLGDDVAELKRTRTVVRNGYENEDWVINNDPWYDGSSHDYTIVDSPSSASVLSTKRIIDITMNHTKSDVTQAKFNIIFPIFDPCKSVNEIIGKGTLENKWKPKGSTDNYLFNSVENSLKVYELIDTVDLQNIQQNVFQILKDPIKSRVHSSDKIEKVTIILSSSKSNFNFLILSINFGRLMSREISENLKSFSSSCDYISKVFKNAYKVECGNLVFKEPVYSVFAEFTGEKMKNLDVGQDVFNACSFLDKTRALTDGKNERERMEKVLHRVSAGTVFGLSRNCFMLASIMPPKLSDNGITKSQFLEEYERKFDDQWLKEWIVILHEHFFMDYMKTRLGLVDTRHMDDLSDLRSELVDFTANYCFAQVTNDPTGAELYNRWKNLLTIKELNTAVSDQVKALNENVSKSLGDYLTSLSLIFFLTPIALSILAILRSPCDLSAKIVLVLIVLILGASGVVVLRGRKWLRLRLR